MVSSKKQKQLFELPDGSRTGKFGIVVQLVVFYRGYVRILKKLKHFEFISP